MVIGFGIGVEKFMNSRAFFIAISFVSSDSQKKESSEGDFVCRDVGTSDREMISFVYSASGIQKNESSITDFVCGDTGDEMSFLGGAICKDTTCCIGAVGTGISTTLCTGAI